MKFNIETNVEALIRDLTGTTKKACNAAAEELKKTALEVESTAKQNITSNGTVDTGRLLGSVKTKIKESNGSIEAEVGTNVEYANYIEYGTRKMGAKPFLNPAFDSKTEGLHERIRQAVRNATK